MLNRILSVVIILPLAIVLIALVVANRGLVGFSIDPFNPANPSLSFQAPLFALVFAALLIGMVVGSIATWMRQAPYRRMARRSHDADARPATGREPAPPRA